MSTIAHWLDSDYNTGEGTNADTWLDRIGLRPLLGVSGSGIKNATPFPTGPNNPAVRAGYVFGGDIVVITDQAPWLTPAPGQVRTYEMLVWHADSEAAVQIGSTPATNSWTVYIGDGGFIETDIVIGGSQTGQSVAYAVASETYHYWTVILDLTTTSGSLKVYDGTALVFDVAVETDISTWAVQAAATELRLLGPSNHRLIEFMVHDTALTLEQITNRTAQFRALLAQEA